MVSTQDSQSADNYVKQQSITFLNYLSAVARETGPRPIRRYELNESFITQEEIESSDYARIGPDEEHDAWLSISRPPHFIGITLPEPLNKVIDPESIADPLTQPALSPDMVDRYVEQEMNKNVGFSQGRDLSTGYEEAQNAKQRALIREKISDAFSEWKDTQWKQWSEKNHSIARAAILYNNFYGIFQQLQQETESKEIIWGQAIATRTSDDPETRVEYPLLLTTMSIRLEPDGSISLAPSSSTQFDFSPLEGVGITGIDGLAKLQKYLSVEETTIDIWDKESLHNFERQIVAQLGGDAYISDVLAPIDTNMTANGSIVLADQWVVMLCKKKQEEEQFYKRLSDELANNDFFPEALESIILDKDTLSQTNILNSSESDDDSSLESERLLFPLPSNDEQERIARQIGRSAGVTVQGPPGTGKTHTIANLVCHLLAQGKRVLVTAEKAQALNVLQDKIPAPIRDLTMAFIGSTPDAMAKLKNSAQRMQDAVASVNPVSEQSTVSRLQQQLDQLQEQLALSNHELDEALESQTREFILPEGSRRATDVARWVATHQDEDIITDDIGPDEPFPLTQSEFLEFIHLCKGIDPQEAAEANFDPTLVTNLPDGTTVNGLFAKLRSAEQSSEQLQDAGLRIKAINSVSDRDIEQLQKNIDTGIEALDSVDDHLQQVFDFQHLDQTILNILYQRNADVLNNAQLGLEYDQKLSGYNIHVPQGNASDLHALVAAWRQRIVDGHKLGFFTPKDVKAFADAVTINEQQPSTSEQLDFVDLEIDRQAQWDKTSHTFEKLVDDFNLPNDTLSEADSFIGIFTCATTIYRTYTWCFEQRPTIEQRIRYLIDMKDPCSSKETLQQCKSLLSHVPEQRKANFTRQQLQSLEQLCDKTISQNPEAPIWKSFKQALLSQDAAAWNRLYGKLNHLIKVHDSMNRRNQLAQKIIQAGATSWAAAMIRQRGDEQTYLSADSVENSWEIAKARTWLSTLHRGPSVETISNQSAQLSNQIRELTVDLIRRQALMYLHKTAGDSERRALSSWLDAMRHVGKGTGKNAPRFLAQAQAVLPKAMGAVPAWIMPIDQVLRSFQPGTTRPFDVVIVDESSQCGLMSVGVLALGKKAIIVGDDRQTSPNPVGQDTSAIAELQNRYLKGFPEKSLYTIDASLYSLADRAYGNTILLREHYRSVPEIINYSNRFYDGMIVPLRERIHPQIGNPLHGVFIENAVSQKKGNYRVNKSEAHALVQQIVQCAKMPEYDGLTFGVVTFMQGDQKGLIEKELINQLGYDEIGRRKLRVGNPPTFQGDERDVIFLSMVAHDNSASYVRQEQMQWANVAVSRARDQIWVFYSMDPAKLNANDVRRGIIEYVSDYHEEKHPEKLYELTESQFERDVLEQMLQHGYAVQPQYRVGNYRIDFVVTIAPGYRLAVECDGDAFHGLDKLRDDIRRQRTLERCGWNFWRIRGSEYYLDPEAAMQPLWHRLEEMRKQAKQDITSM